MKIIRARDYRDMSRKAANIVSAQIIMKPNAVLGLATGGTMEGIYDQLVEWYGKGDLDFSEVTTVNLDEYRDLAGDHPQSYMTYMRVHLFDRVNMDPARIHIPDGADPDEAKVCREYEESIRRLGGIDLQLLGIGTDGHIGFNEPGGAFEMETHSVELTDSTIDANARFFACRDDVPRRAYTMGIKSIMQAHKVLLAASGKNKAEILRRAFLGPVTPEVPASILQMHPDMTLVGDEEALSLLE